MRSRFISALSSGASLAVIVTLFLWPSAIAHVLASAWSTATGSHSPSPVDLTPPQANNPAPGSAAPAPFPTEPPIPKGWVSAAVEKTNENLSVAPGHGPLSTRVVAYTVNAKLDPATHKITATETLVYHNLTGQPQQEFPFHLYLNAFEPQSTFMSEQHISNPDYGWKNESYGAIKISSIAAEGMGDLAPTMHFIQPDDNNTLDHTVMQVKLPKPVAAGADVTFNISFEDTMPEVVARTGYIRDFYMVGQWFPKVGVWWKGAWNCHQFHYNTEFFADFGTFDMQITLPQNEVVGAGADLLSTTNNSDGTKTLKFHSEDVHDFSWTASPSFTDVEDSWTSSSGNEVKIHLLMSPGHESTTQRYLKVLKGTLTKFDEWYGPYPYDRITVVDPPHGGQSAGGMEYPTLVTADTFWHVPKGAFFPELVLEHEFGHQYWYGMVATNEFEEAWLDEGINSYTEVKIMGALYGDFTSAFHIPFGTAGDIETQRLEYITTADTDPITRRAWQFMNGNAYGGITYGKTASVLLTLENIVGEDTMRRALHTYFMRFRFTHPTGTDFLNTLQEVSGKDLKWYFDQAVSGTAILDYEVSEVRSDPNPWWKESHRHSSNTTPETAESESAAKGKYRNYVLVRRRGDFVFPVEILVKFEDGSSRTEHWDGRDRWVRYSYDLDTKVASAEVDPHHQIWIDSNFINNAKSAEPDNRASFKLKSLLTFVEEMISQSFGWLS
jgi:Peptidase family M1 domain